MKSKQLLLSLFAATAMTAACTKKTDNNTDANIQKVIDQTNADNQAEIEKVKSDFEHTQNKINQTITEADRQTDEALATVQKTTLNYVNKLVRVDVLDENGKIKKSYLDFFDLDAASGSFNSKFETLMSNEGAGICINLASLDCETTFSFNLILRHELVFISIAPQFEKNAFSKALESFSPKFIEVESGLS